MKFFLFLILLSLPAPLLAQGYALPAQQDEDTEEEVQIVPEAPSVPDPSRIQGPPDPREARFNRCLDLAIDDPIGGISDANDWLRLGGGHFARHCLAFAYSRQQRWEQSAEAFAQAAQEAEAASDDRVTNLWIQASNAALAGGQSSSAIAYIDAALATGQLEGQALGLAHLDRARALVALNRLEDARAEFVLVQKYAPEDPLGWLLSATLERRLDNLERARADIDIAYSLAADDPDIGLELGVIAILSGDEAAARAAWQPVANGPRPGQARLTARQYLKQLDDAAAAPATASANDQNDASQP